MSATAATSPIVETVTTTINPDRTVNCAAMAETAPPSAMAGICT